MDHIKQLLSFFVIITCKDLFQLFNIFLNKELLHLTDVIYNWPIFYKCGVHNVYGTRDNKRCPGFVEGSRTVFSSSWAALAR